MTEPDWKSRFFDAIKALHGALDILEDIDSECLLTGHLKDRVDEALAPRRSACTEKEEETT